MSKLTRIAPGLRLMVLALMTLRAAGAEPVSGHATVIELQGAIGPAMSRYVQGALSTATEQHSVVEILQIDTPGGLDTSMRDIIKAILASPVPVVAYVAPSGARAASAGTYILYACHIAAMAPATNLGAATPISIGGGEEPSSPSPTPGTPATPASPEHKGTDGASTAAAHAAPTPEASPTPSTASERKAVNDAVAYIRSLAQLRGRNADWAERAVREAVSLSATEALAQHVVDLNARDLPDLLRQLDGRRITIRGGDVTLDTAHAPIVTLEADWRSRFLAVITDPNVALVLLMIGMYGLFFEFANPGFVLPGVVGAISLLIGLFAMQMLPVNYVGLVLIFLGIAFLIGEAFLPTFGSLGVGGVVAFVIGALMLIDTDVPGYGIPLPMIAAVVAFSVLFVLGVSRLALRARRRPVVTGAEALIGSIGVVLDGGLLPGNPAENPVENPADYAAGRAVGNATTSPTRNAVSAANRTATLPEITSADAPLAGWAQVHGERWRVSSAAPVAAGHTVRVIARRGLTLTVVPAEGRPQGERS